MLLSVLVTARQIVSQTRKAIRNNPIVLGNHPRWVRYPAELSRLLPECHDRRDQDLRRRPLGAILIKA